MVAEHKQETTAAPAPFAGFTQPTYTTVPDELFDALLPVLSGAELKVLLYIVRRTFGFKRESDAISLSQMATGLMTRDGRRLDGGTGLSRPALVTALKSLAARGVIIAERHSSTHHGFEPTVYRLAMAPHQQAAAPTQGTPPSSETQPPLVKLVTYPSSETQPPLVKKLNIQETEGHTDSTQRVEDVCGAGARDAQEKATAATAQNPERAARALALCVELRIPPTDAALKAMANVVKDFGAAVGRPLEDVAVDAADWLDRKPKRQRSVAFFRGWLKREVAGPPASTQCNGPGASAPAATVDDTAAEMQRFRAERAQRKMEQAWAYGRPAGEGQV